MTPPKGPRPFRSGAPQPATPRAAMIEDVHPDAVRMVQGSMVRSVTAEEAEDFGIATDQPCLVIERVYYSADDDVLRHTTTVDFSDRGVETRLPRGLDALSGPEHE